MHKGFQIWNNHGFSMKFDNGVTISVQFSYGNYCKNKISDVVEKSIGIDCNDAEIAIIKDSKFITNEFPGWDNGDPTVMGWCSADMVADAIEFAKNYNTGGI